MRVNAASLDIRDATTSTPGTLNYLTTDLIMANNNNNMLCSAVLVEWLLLKPCCVEMCGMLFVMYGSSVFSSVFAITEMGLYDVPMFMSLFGFGIGMMFASLHV